MGVRIELSKRLAYGTTGEIILGMTLHRRRSYEPL